MLRRYRKIKEDMPLFSAKIEDDTLASGCHVSRLMSFIFFCLHLSSSIYKASGTYETLIILIIIISVRNKIPVIHEEVKSHNLQAFKAIFRHSYAMTSRFLPNGRMFYRKQLHDMV